MTKADAAKLVAVVVTAYPNYDKFKSAEAVQATVNLWAMMFESDDGALVALAVKKHIATNKWPPSVAEIREIMLDMVAPDLIPPDVAWQAVADLMKELGEFASDETLARELPPMTMQAVHTLDWYTLKKMHRAAYVNEKPGMDRVAFMQVYTPMYERAKMRAMTPENITHLIDDKRALRLAELPQLTAGEYDSGESW